PGNACASRPARLAVRILGSFRVKRTLPIEVSALNGACGYSYLRDVIGSTAAARRAGPHAAARPVTPSSAATARKLTGSLGRSPGTRNIASGFTRKKAQSRPAAEPIRISFAALASTMNAMSRRSAPEIKRLPLRAGMRFDPPQSRAHGLQLCGRRRGAPYDKLHACAIVIDA